MMKNLDLRAWEARVNVTWDGQNGDLPQAVAFAAGDRELKGWIAEALTSGSIPGVRARGHVDLRDFVVDRFPADREVPFNRIFLRPSTPFG